MARLPIPEPITMTFPEPRLASRGIAARTVRKAPVRLTSMTLRQLSMSVSSIDCSASSIPALTITISTPPNVCSAIPKNPSTEAELVTSNLSPTATPPAFRIISTVSAVSRCDRAPQATHTPASARPMAIALPIPRPDPVTTATLPFSADWC